MALPKDTIMMALRILLGTEIVESSIFFFDSLCLNYKLIMVVEIHLISLSLNVILLQT